MTLSLSEKFSDSFSISRMCFYSFGLLPFPDANVKWRPITDTWFWLNYINLVVCAILETTTLIHGIATNPSDFVGNVAVIPLLSYTTIGLEQMGSFYRKRERIIRLVVALRDVFTQHTETDLQRYNFAKFKARNRKLQISYATSYITLIMTFNFISISRSIVNYLQHGPWHLELPYPVWYPFNVRDGRIFLFAYVQQLWWGFTCVFGVLAINLMLGTITDHICFEFDALGMNLRAMRLNRSHAAEDRDEIRRLVARHNSIFDLAEGLQYIMSFTLLMNYILITVVMCTVGFQVIASDSLSESFKFLLFLLVCMLQSLSLSYFGNCIIEASDSVCDRVYESDWLDGDLTSKKFLLLIMVRSRRNACLRAESFSIVSLQSFGTIVSSSYSYFTILRQTYYGPGSDSTGIVSGL